jgi:hypothetical protein
MDNEAPLAHGDSHRFLPVKRITLENEKIGRFFGKKSLFRGKPRVIVERRGKSRGEIT